MSQTHFNILKNTAVISMLSIVLILGTIESGFSGSKINCINRCVFNHSQWGQFNCRPGEDYYIIGQKCYEIQNECFLSCNIFSDNLLSEIYLPSKEQVTNQWRQKKACSPYLEKLPLELLPGNHLIEPDWAGQCECLNGNLFIGECGHNKLSCDQVCNLGTAF